jgi:hypothetical protein
VPINLSKSEFYRREADRLTSMAHSATFEDVKPELIVMAAHFLTLAQRYEAKWPRAEQRRPRQNHPIQPVVAPDGQRERSR